MPNCGSRGMTGRMVIGGFMVAMLEAKNNIIIKKYLHKKQNLFPKGDTF